MLDYIYPGVQGSAEAELQQRGVWAAHLPPLPSQALHAGVHESRNDILLWNKDRIIRIIMPSGHILFDEVNSNILGILKIT